MRLFTGRTAPGGRAGPRPVSRLRSGESAHVVRIASADPSRLVRLASLGLVAGVSVTLVQRSPALVLQVGETCIALDTEIAGDILVDGGSAGAPSGP